MVAEPGKKFSYTTFGFTLTSAVLEKVSGLEFKVLANNLFKELGLKNTQLDVNERIVNYRSNYYHRNNRHVLENCPEVDCSYKWAGGGIISNVNDLLIFANSILTSKLTDSKDTILSNSTISQFLTPQIRADRTAEAGLGWFIVDGPNPHFYHTGGAVGASSVLIIYPESEICIAILCNLQETSVLSLARTIESIFRE
ncbi:unnamed protein product [Caenorhabditis angaria]|uniref:Beta-lactamase-related domain-containing protein n=1 Tax=Caenorhabditis angaria TaxID=860376 RepID=A0A9P1IP01_9PELO|nr:unnamed protein product [Caenorhabditis angaria]